MTSETSKIKFRINVLENPEIFMKGNRKLIKLEMCLSVSLDISKEKLSSVL